MSFRRALLTLASASLLVAQSAGADPVTPPDGKDAAPDAAAAVAPSRAETLAQYGKTLAGLIAAEVRKRESDDAGTVVVTFGVDRQGKLAELRVVHHMGMMSIDGEVSRAIERAAASFPAPPEGEADPVFFTVPINLK